MRFISNGDYIFPLHFSSYWAEHFYTWSFERGAANPDGIMRLPGRLIDVLVFGLFGNLGIGYFYVLSCLVIAFVCFWWFARTFLEAARPGIQLIGALLFTLNPIFLGNLSKVGLVLAVAMLPLCLAALKQGFAQRRFSYFLLYIVGLNISLLHPFTFSVNAVVSLVYLVMLMQRHWVFVRDHVFKFAYIAGLGLALNMYVVLPLVSLGSIDKSVLSDSATTATSAPVDYTSLVDVANTGDLFTALSLSKGVFKDYEFFGTHSWPFYFMGVFLLYGLLLGVYIKVEQRAKARDRQRLVTALGLFLLLMVLATATYMHADILIKWLIGLPGGWMFRSPLKWQLYMPLALFTALVIALKYVMPGWRLKALYGGLLLSCLLMNGYLGVQIYHRLLTPRTIRTFSGLATQPLEQKNLLVVANNNCLTAARGNPAQATELNEVLLSKHVQVKRVSSGAFGAVQAGAYDFVLACRGAASEEILTKQYSFQDIASYQNGLYTLYQNRTVNPYAATTAAVFTATGTGDVAAQYQFAAHTLKARLVTAEATTNTRTPNAQTPARTLTDVLSGLKPDMIKNSTKDGTTNGYIQTTLAVPPSTALYVARGDTPLYYKLKGDTVAFSTVNIPGVAPVTAEPIAVPQTNKLTVGYVDPSFAYRNLIANPSLEKGLWEAKVGDCNAYDDHPGLRMSQSNKAADGAHSLQLEATAHIACTGPNDIAVKPGQHYMLSFDYQSANGATAGYFAGFDDVMSSDASERLPDSHGKWQNFTTELTVPAGASNLKLTAYAFPSTLTNQPGIARYDNFKLIAIPPVAGKFFAVTGDNTKTTAQVSTERRNPTKQLLRVTRASTPFYLSTKESYAAGWHLGFDTGQSKFASILPWAAQALAAPHVRLNGSFNGWYLEPAKLCQTLPKGCSQNADGSYNLMLVMEFMPQRWFYTGTVISAAAAVSALSFVWFERRSARTGRGK